MNLLLIFSEQQLNMRFIFHSERTSIRVIVTLFPLWETVNLSLYVVSPSQFVLSTTDGHTYLLSIVIVLCASPVLQVFPTIAILQPKIYQDII